uniref:Zinc finger, CCHC-type n=1 Tax=Strongyloides papillosus TaxID=174720 RepID=A0A0N5B1S2_STREA
MWAFLKNLKPWFGVHGRSVDNEEINSSNRKRMKLDDDNTVNEDVTAETNISDPQNSRGSRSLIWLPRYPDLTPMDYFFWEYVKSLVHSEKSTTLEEFKEKIRKAFKKVNDDKEMLERTF